MGKKLYRVFENIKQENDFEIISEQDIPLGYTHANSFEKAISNVKHAKGIRKRNYYEKDNYLTNCVEKHKFYAIEVDEKDPVNEYIIERR